MAKFGLATAVVGGRSFLGRPVTVAGSSNLDICISCFSYHISCLAEGWPCVQHEQH